MSEGIFCRVDGVWLTPDNLLLIEQKSSLESSPADRLTRRMLKQLGVLTYREYIAGNMNFVSWREIRDIFATKQCRIIIEEGKIVACAACRDLGRCIEIGTVVVHPSHRGRGLATEVVKDALLVALSRGKPVVALANRMSQGLFRKLGFAERPKSDMPADLLPGCENCPQMGAYPSCRCRFMVYETG